MRRIVALACLAAALAGCGDDGEASETARFAEVRRVDVEAATGLAVVDGEHLIAGELRTGRLLAIDLDDDVNQAREVATVPDVDGSLEQGGLLDVTSLGDGHLAVAVTGTGGALRIDELDVNSGEVLRTRWEGPEAQERANGGRMATLADGRLVVGVGDLLDPALVDDPTAPNGKVLAIAPDGTADVVAEGFNNPFALGTDGVDLWVADNAPGSRAERLLRIDAGGVEELASWDDTRVPSGLAVLHDGHLAICWFATGELSIVDRAEPGDVRGQVIAEDCRYGVARTPDGLAYAAEDEVVLLEDLAPPDDD